MVKPCGARKRSSATASWQVRVTASRYMGVRMPITSESYETQDLVSAPRLGADTDEILTDLGYTGEAIAALRAAGTIAAL